MSSRPSASNSDLYINGDPAFPVFDDSYSKFEVTEKRMDSDDVICLPASEVRAVCPDLMPKPMPRPVPGCPPNFGPSYQGGRFGPSNNYGGTYGIGGGFDAWDRPSGGDGGIYRPPVPRPTKRPMSMDLLSRRDGMYHGRHVTARGLKATRFNKLTLVSPKARGGPLNVTVSRAKGNAITDIRLGRTRLLRAATADSVTQTTMSYNVPVGFHTNTNKAAEGGYTRDPWEASSSISLAQAAAGRKVVYTKTRAAFVRRPGETVRGERVINRARVSDIVMEKRIKMLGGNSFSYGVTLTYPRTHKFMTTRTSVFRSVSPKEFSRVTALTKAGRWVAVPISKKRKYLSVIDYQALVLSTANGAKSIGASLHDFPKSKAGNWFKPVTQYSVGLMSYGGVGWSVVQQLGKRNAMVLGWARQGRQGRRVRRRSILPVGKFSYGMTWSAGTMAQTQAALLKAAQTKGRQADTNIIDVAQQTCTVKKKLNRYCKNLKCKKNDKRGKCGKCMDCVRTKAVVNKPGVGPRICTVKTKLNQYCKNLKCKTNDKRGKCAKCMDCKYLGLLPGGVPPLDAKQLARAERNKAAKAARDKRNRDKKNKNKKKKCEAVNSAECAGCTVNDPLPECEGCTVCK